jgi:hypothetical protein
MNQAYIDSEVRVVEIRIVGFGGLEHVAPQGIRPQQRSTTHYVQVPLGSSNENEATRKARIIPG